MPNPTVKSSLSSLTKFVSQRLLIRLSGQKLFLPFYHAVSTERLPHISHLYTLRPTTLFRKDLEWLLKYYQPVSLTDVWLHATGQKRLQKPAFHLTFDDGLREVYDVAAPILQVLGIPATVFVNSGFVGNTALFYRYKASMLIEAWQTKPLSAAAKQNITAILHQAGINAVPVADGLRAIDYTNKHILDEIAAEAEVDFTWFLQNQRPYMDAEQIQTLAAQGFSIGAHSIDHPLYRLVSEGEQLRQTLVSLAAVQQLVKPKHAVFSFPFSDDGVGKAFFDAAFDPTNPFTDLTFGVSGLKADYAPRHLHRFPMEGTLHDAQTLIKTEYLYCLLKQWAGQNRISRQ